MPTCRQSYDHCPNLAAKLRRRPSMEGSPPVSKAGETRVDDPYMTTMFWLSVTWITLLYCMEGAFCAVTWYHLQGMIHVVLVRST
jgi:hypothetical protein